MQISQFSVIFVLHTGNINDAENERDVKQNKMSYNYQHLEF